MKENHFEKWIPHKDVDAVYDMEDVGYDTGEGFVVVLIPDNLDHGKHSKYNIKLNWHGVLSYTVTKETYRPDVWISNSDNAWSFYVSQSSQLLKNFKKNNILVPEKVYHFFIVGTNFVIDILSTEYPEIVLTE